MGSIDLSRQEEIAFCQAVDVVSPNFNSASAPTDMKVWVVPLRFCNITDLIGEAHGFDKIPEDKELLQMSRVIYLPIIPQFTQELADTFIGYPRRIAIGWDTRVVCELCHLAPPRLRK